MTNAIARPAPNWRSIGCLTVFLTVFFAVCATAPLSSATRPSWGTEILWDRYGIPHITARDYPSLFYAYGYPSLEGRKVF